MGRGNGGQSGRSYILPGGTIRPPTAVSTRRHGVRLNPKKGKDKKNG